MNSLELLLLLVFLVIVSYMITNVVRIFSIKYNLFDIPNKRSSHDEPTPKGGGISIVLILLATIFALAFYNLIDSDLSVSLISGICIVSLVGFVDDFKNLPTLFRAVMYVLCAFISIHLIGVPADILNNNYSFYLSCFTFVASVFFVVWLTNLYNFMDGTDGLAATQAICVSFFCGLTMYLSGHVSISIILFCIVSSSIGFIFWNWAPAKIFMGDVGSCTLGFVFGILAIYTDKQEIVSISIWLILLAPFIGDATFTLIKRIINRESWYKAHKSHAYQKLYQLGMSHDKLAFSLLKINIFIIWPLAFIAVSNNNLELIMMVISYSIIGVIWVRVNILYNRMHKKS